MNFHNKNNRKMKLINFAISRGAKNPLFVLRGVLYLFFVVITILISYGIIDNQYFSIVIPSIIFLFLPGAIVASWIYKGRFEFVEKVVIAFVFSLIINFFPVILGYIFQISISELIIFLVLIYTCLALIDLNKLLGDRKKVKFNLKIDFISAAVILMGIFFLVVSVKAGSYLGSDSRAHMSIIRKSIEYSFINSSSAHFIDGGIYWVYAYSVWHMTF